MGVQIRIAAVLGAYLWIAALPAGAQPCIERERPVRLQERVHFFANGEAPGEISRSAGAPDPAGLSSNIDYAGRALFGYGSMNSWGHTVAVDPVLKRAYVGFYSTLAILNVADKHRPSLLGWLDMDSHQITSILVPSPGSTTIFVGTRLGRAGKVDVSNPASPSWLSYAAADVREMTLASSSLVLAEGGNLLLLDPTTLATQSSTPLGASAYGVFVLGNLAYVATLSGLSIYDISSPALPSLVSFTPSANARAVSVQDRSGTRFAFVANNSGSPDLTVFDVTVPAAPVLLSAVDLSSGGGYALALNGNTLFLAGTSGGLQVVDVTLPASPAAITSFTASQAYGVALDGTDVYLHGRRDGLVILDASALPSPPVPYGDFPSPGAWGLDIQGRFAYFVNGVGLHVVDLTTLPRPRIVGRLTGFSGVDIHVAGSNAYVADTLGFLRIVNISNPTAPALAASHALPATPNAVRVRNGYAYLACDTAGLVVVRLTDGALFPFATTYPAMGVDVAGNAVYLATRFSDGVNPSTGEVVVVDASSPESPVFVGNAVTQNGVWAVSALGSYLYAATDWGLEIFNDTTPAAPYYVGGLPLTDGFFGVSVADGLAYLAGGMHLKVVDVSSPWSPVEVGSFETEPWPVRPLYHDGYCFLASATAGAYVLHATNACYDRFEPNDDPDHAWPLATASFYDGLICNGADVDYYALAVPSGGTLSATLTPPPGINYDLFLYDPSRTLVASSTLGSGAVETLSWTTAAPGDFTLLVNGADASQFSGTHTYRLLYSFSPCPGPTQPLLIYSARLDPNGNVILDILDPNQPSTVTGYNIYRAGSPSGLWPLRAGNVVDMDQGTANTQYIDAGSNTGGPYYYLVTAVNAPCGAEGP